MTIESLPAIITDSNKVLTITPTAVGTSSFTVKYLNDDSLLINKTVQVVAVYEATDGPSVFSTVTHPLFIRDSHNQNCVLSKVTVCSDSANTNSLRYVQFQFTGANCISVQQWYYYPEGYDICTAGTKWESDITT
jgi:hypothetical protein